MPSIIRMILEAPDLPEEDREKRRLFFERTLLALCAAFTVIFSVLHINGVGPYKGWQCLPLIALFLFSVRLSRRGDYTAGVLISFFGFWFVVAAFAAARGGEYVAPALCFLTAMVFIGIFLNWRAALCAYVLLLLTTLALSIGQIRGWLPAPARSMGPMTLWSATSSIGAVLTLLTGIASRHLHEAILRAGREGEERARAQAVLEQGEKMVIVGRMAGGIAHDFNNYLTAVSLSAEAGLMKAGTNSENAAFRQILDAVTRASELTHQLLTFSRDQPIVPVRLDLNEVVGEMSSFLRTALPGRIAFEIEPSAEPGPILADPVQVRQIIMNLAVNARDAMPDGGTLKIAVSAADRAAPGGPILSRWTVLRVTDSGTGMSPVTRERLFEPFYTTKPAGRGTGLGLAMTHGFVTGAGGFIEVRSEEGKGACFELYWPRVEWRDRAQPRPDAG